jgi:hypothetical protein
VARGGRKHDLHFFFFPMGHGGDKASKRRDWGGLSTESYPESPLLVVASIGKRYCSTT